MATVLIVDDNPANLGVLSDALDQAGFEVWVATSGKMALKRVEYALPQLILLDVMMPEMDGFETCCRFKTNPQTQDIPIVFMTALSDTGNKVEGFQLGAVDYITKPFQQEEVVSRVKLHLKLCSLAQQLAEKNVLLEQKVAEVSQSYDDLQRLQIKLIQSERLSSLGQMVTGIAHEIHNPINFIYGNLDHASHYTQDMLRLLQLYQAEYPQPTPRIQAELNAIDLNFIEADLSKLFASMHSGTQRIQEMIRFMRIFSRVDEADLKAVNIHDGIESVLAILNHRLKAKPNHPATEVIKDYGQLPLVECYAGQLNQVFMNVLSNAIDALNEQNHLRSLNDTQPQLSKIEIRTRTIAENWIAIHILNNGAAIDDDTLSQRCASLLTYPPKGSQLGLSISHQIITEKHHGRLYCQLVPGQGVEFVIEIPARQLAYEMAEARGIG